MQRKKLPSDYPQIAFRISNDDKLKIQSLVEDVLRSSNDRLEQDERVLRKNDVFIDALYLGLLTMKKRGYRMARFKP